jgi:hypothetical protein
MGGPSLKELVKKEVAKQIAKATGPTGPAGPAGANGASGASGAPGPGAVRLQFSQPETDNTIRTLGTVNELTVNARCRMAGPGIAIYDLFAQSSVGGAEIEGTRGFSNNDGTVNWDIPIAAFVDTSFPGTTLDARLAPTGGFIKGFLQLTFFTSSRVISLQLYVLANDGNGTCQVHGTAVPAS